MNRLELLEKRDAFLPDWWHRRQCVELDEDFDEDGGQFYRCYLCGRVEGVLITEDGIDHNFINFRKKHTHKEREYRHYSAELFRRAVAYRIYSRTPEGKAEIERQNTMDKFYSRVLKDGIEKQLQTNPTVFVSTNRESKTIKFRRYGAISD